VNDAERLSRHPAMRVIVDHKGLKRSAASTSQMGRFETKWLAKNENLVVLTSRESGSTEFIDRRSPK
jgi:predicted TIM-barrel fold metal-dependent hydrolase